MSLGKYFTESPDFSSLRLNMFMATVAFLPVPLTVAFYIVWQTVHGSDPSWSSVSLFVASIAAYFTALWYGKKINKDAENKETPPTTP
jgi:hypothetical protein